MALSAEKLATINSIGLTAARRMDGLAAYPPYPYTILRNATLTVARELAIGGKIPLLLATLKEYEAHGEFIHPKSAAFLLVMVDVLEGATARPMLHERDGDDAQEEDLDEDPIVLLARKIGESPMELRAKSEEPAQEQHEPEN